MRYHTLDHWRGLAALTIVVFHSTLFASTPELQAELLSEPFSSARALDWIIVATSRFWVAVPVFFVISGYCICASADSLRVKNHSVRHYFSRRIKRIFPPYLFALGLCSLVSFVVYRFAPWIFNFGGHTIPDPLSLTASQWVGNLTLTEGWRSRFWGDPTQFQLIVAWTLCFEEQFYLVVGLILCSSRKRLFLGLTLVTVFVFLNSASLNIRPLRMIGLNLNQYQLNYPALFLRWNWLDFAVGCAVYFRINHATKIQRRAIDAILAIGLALVVLRHEDLFSFRAAHGQFRCAAIVFGGVLIALHRVDLAMSRQFLLRPFKALGDMCYSIYLVHYPITIGISSAMHQCGVVSSSATLFIVVPLCVASSLLVGTVFYRYVEQRWQNASISRSHSAGAEMTVS